MTSLVLSLLLTTQLSMATTGCGDPSLQLVSEVADIIEDHYIDKSVTRERLLFGAIQGMLAQVEGISYEHQLVSNHLLFPSQYSQVRRALEGELVGIGIHVNLDPATNKSIVTGIIPNSPGHHAGIKTGDTLIAVNGERISTTGLSNFPLKPGITIGLLMERDGELFRLHVKQQRLKLPAVTASPANGHIGYLKIARFHQFVPPKVKQHLKKFEEAKIRGLILDLRDNPGGRIDDAITTAEFFLNPGLKIATMKYRTKAPQTFTTSQPPVWRRPMVVLVNNGTSGGAEVLASAIRFNKRGVLIGEKTFGKSTIQSIFPLSNEFALKLTTARIETQDGIPFEGSGIIPDLVIPPLGDPHNNQDRQFSSAIEILRYKIEQEEPTISKPDQILKAVNKE